MHYTSSIGNHTHNFNNVVDLVAECGAKELQTHLLTASKNATYIHSDYVAKYIDIMNKYLKAPLFASLRTGKYALYDQTQDISSIEQIAIRAAFQHRNCISEYYIRILSISELVGATSVLQTFFGALNKYLQEMNISLSNGRFFCMDTTNVNSDKQSGLKQLLKHAAPLGNWVGYGNHKVALCFRHLLNNFPNVLSVDATFSALLPLIS